MLQGDVVGQRAVGDDHRRGVRADVAGQALDLHRQRRAARGSRGRCRSSFFSSSLFSRADLSVIFSSSGTMATTASTRGMGMPKRPAHVADGRPRRQRAERADLGHVLHAVLVLDVLDHLAAALLAEVDVDIGRLAAALVEEPLEQQVVFQRADVAQVQARRPPASRRPIRGPWPGCPAARAKRTKSHTMRK